MLTTDFAPLIINIAEILGLGLFIAVAAVALGHFLEEIVFEILFKLLLPIGACFVGYLLGAAVGFVFLPPPDLAARVSKAQGWGVAGFVLTVILSAGWLFLSSKREATSESGARRGGWFFSLLWLGLCAAGWIGHAAGEWLGLLTITAPAILTFWLLLYYFARFILPLEEGQSLSTAFRCLSTFSAGTNYPYYVLEGREKVERVPGNQFRQDPLRGTGIFGPGIFLTGPDHVVAVSDGLKFKGVRGPGVTFTHLFEATQEPMDLRPQQRPYTVEAITKDGVPVKFTTFGPFQLDAGEQQPQLGKPFPFHAKSIFKAFHAQPIDIQRYKVNNEVFEERKRRRWDELYAMIGTHIMQDIIAKYKFDELCEPLDPEKDPRKKIAKEYRKSMKKELPEYGIKIPGGGVSNLFPADKDAVLSKRIETWQAQWQRRMSEQLGLAEAEAERLVGQARAKIQAEMIQSISEAIGEVATDDEEVIFNTVALRFVDSLNQMVTQSPVRDRVSGDDAEVIETLPHIIGRE